ncbi:polyhydroxyalkanoate synthesis regulator phasin [Symbiobacterium terraclitae]|uniref:Polyhydroxyalkanoate synthesis regulator phasin n=1 Tax=Symbiobacterium terraclitae TaxID=557451 RepID=A0ABS4JUB9_9FIRM|nr:hypothetical protein [Symbiobacterium terraclitae]MBP2018064.1 polyhydroxyalkanoate synthesis regulator phasin [Symbiobacterium terraclitae]
MNRTKRWVALVLVSLWTLLLLSGSALAAETRPEKEKPKLSPGMEQLLNDIRTLRRTRMEQLNAEIDQLIERAQASGQITAEEAARLKEWRALRRHGLSPHASEAEVKARLEEAVKNGRLTKQQAKQLLKEWQESRNRMRTRGRP